ncbi:MAG: DUF1844 domain-containing protein [Acidobacteria bacterium]|nr:DUF1844 domain-containing protein [Acidobacteriota bacterium]
MSEEKPTFKVTDRRLFNPDGSPRADIPREEQPPPAPAPPAAATAEQPAPASARSDSAQAEREAASPARPEPAETDDSYDPAAAAEQQQQQQQGGDAEADPTPFANLVMFIASPAAAAMGMTEHPGLAPGEVDLPLAKHCIDLLAIVREKSRGNLGQQEQQIIDGLLAELRMQYVSLTSAPRPAAPRGFTGGDITGGR